MACRDKWWRRGRSTLWGVVRGFGRRQTSEVVFLKVRFLNSRPACQITLALDNVSKKTLTASLVSLPYFARVSTFFCHPKSCAWPIHHA